MFNALVHELLDLEIKATPRDYILRGSRDTVCVFADGLLQALSISVVLLCISLDLIAVVKAGY